jgi:hypothetical protein
VEWVGDWVTDLVTDLKTRYYIWLGLAAELVRAGRAMAKMGEAERRVAAERNQAVEVRVGSWLTDLKIRHYVEMLVARELGAGRAVGGRRRLWFGARWGAEGVDVFVLG